ncbi:MAG: periplasmic heavy metal sensor [Luminiphilus sp.]|nr:periplasmic heavy metal sensor [Luminiphilus sp.]
MTKRTLTILLIGSLTINLTVAGVLVGRWSAGDMSKKAPMIWAFKEVSPESRQRLRPLLKESTREVLPLRRDLKRAERKVFALIRQDDIDEAALTQALADLRAAILVHQEAIHEVGVEAFSQLNRDDRMVALRYLMRPPGEQRRPEPKRNMPAPEAP